VIFAVAENAAGGGGGALGAHPANPHNTKQTHRPIIKRRNVKHITPFGF
jgi:hypothetical protein